MIPTLTGASSFQGEENANGAYLAVEQINARPGGVYDGRKIRLIQEDAAGENQTAIAALNKLLSQDLDALVLPVLSTQIQAMVPIMRRQAMPWLTGGTAAKNSTYGLPNMFRMRASNAVYATAMVSYAAKEIGARKVAILHSSDAFGVDGGDQCERNLKEQGLSAQIRLSYPLNARDFTAPLLKVRQSGADLLLVFLVNPADVALILSQYRQLGLGIPLVGSPTLANQDALNVAAANADGIYVAIDYAPGADNRVTAQFVQDFKARFGKLPDIGQGSGWVYDCVNLLCDTYRDNRSTDRIATVEALRRVKDWNGTLGRFSCDAVGDMVHEVAFAQIKGGQPHLIRKVSG